MKLNGLILILTLLFLLTDSKAQELEFSHEGGIYEEPFELTISSEVEGAVINYSLNGKNPVELQNSLYGSSPATIMIDPANVENRDKAPGFIITACAILGDSLISEIKTRTYLFVNKVIELSPDGVVPGEGWLVPNSSAQDINYGMDPEVYNNSKYKDKIEDALLSIPSISIVTDLSNLFDPDSGIYVNALRHGIQWEREASIELLNTDGSDGFAENCGIRIRGGWSRNSGCPKRAFRIFFRKEYGEGKLDYPLFGEEGADEFDKIDFRTSMNYSWAFTGDNRNTFIREVFSRDTQREMGQPYTRSRYYHLYINGTYWGLYQTQERAEAAYGETYFGGHEDDYDVIKVNVGESYELYDIEATDGTTDAWHRLWTLATYSNLTNMANYYSMQGLNTDGTINPDKEKLLDVDNLIDYMICTFFVGDFDGPISWFSGNINPNNFYAIYNRNKPDGFKFFRHDAEHSMLEWNGQDRTGPFPAGSKFLKSNPQWIHQKLSVNSHYRIKFADRVYKHLFNDGALTFNNCVNRINERKSQIEEAIIAESARWGDSKSNTALTKDDWLTAVEGIIKGFLPGRSGMVLNQLKSKELWTEISPAQFSKTSGVVEKGSEIELSANSGTIYYTLDGTDPFLPIDYLESDENSIDNLKIQTQSAGSIEYTDPIEINSSTVIYVRAYDEGKWSPLSSAKFVVEEDLSDLKITELHYHPAEQDTINDTEYEFLELKNTGEQELDIGGAVFTDGIDYTFPIGTTIQSGQFIVVCSNADRFSERYGFDTFDEYEAQLSNSGEKLVLESITGDTVFAFSYDDDLPWPIEADGDGNSLVSKNSNPNGNPGEPDYWRLSKEVHGSPGKDDLVSNINHENIKVKPEDFDLFQNFPNPFNPSTTIRYNLKKDAKVEITVYSLTGEKVKVLVNDFKSQGEHTVKFSPSKLASGIYYYTINADDYFNAKKMIYLK